MITSRTVGFYWNLVMLCCVHKGPCKRTQQVTTLLRVVGQQRCVRLHWPKSLTGLKLHATSVAVPCKQTQHVRTNNVERCWPTMLRSFAWALTASRISLFTKVKCFTHNAVAKDFIQNCPNKRWLRCDVCRHVQFDKKKKKKTRDDQNVEKFQLLTEGSYQVKLSLLKYFHRDRGATLRLGVGPPLMTRYWGGGGTRHLFLPTLIISNSKNIGGHVPPPPLVPLLCGPCFNNFCFYWKPCLYISHFI